MVMYQRMMLRHVFFTALHMASGSQHAECVSLLLQHGAQDTSDVTGTMARDLALKENVISVFGRLNTN